MTDTWTYHPTPPTLTRGNIRIVDATTDHGVSREQLQGIADEVWALAQTYPPANPGKVTVTVKPSAALESSDDSDGGYVAGQTAAFTAHITLNEAVLSDDSPGNTSMPIAEHVPVWEYTVAHEYGHAFTSRAVADSGDGVHVAPEFIRQWLAIAYAGGLSMYGESSPVEGYAEGFAEWTLTHGDTRNRAARAYARAYAWPALPARTI